MSRTLFGIALLGVLPFVVPASEVSASDADVLVTVSCPETVSKRSRAPIDVSVSLENQKFFAASLTRGAVLTHAGNDRILGPVPFPLSVNLPCKGCTATLPTMPVAVPTVARAGTMITLGIGVFSAGNQLRGHNACVVEIVP